MSLQRRRNSKPKDSDSYRPTICCGGRYVLEFATCPFDRGTLPTAWQAAASRTGMPGRRFPCPGPSPRQGKGLPEIVPKAACMNEVERWSELPDGATEFTMRRLRTAD
jgi:hypothetical protein